MFDKLYNETKHDIDYFTIIVRWIGWDVTLGREKRPFLEDGEPKLPVDGPTVKFQYEKDEYKFDRYGLTTKGEAINLDQYCLRLANHDKDTHVYLFQNWDKFNQVSVKDIDWTVPFNELKLTNHIGLK